MAHPNGTDGPSESYIPTIDISPYMADPGSDAAAAVVAEVRQACITTGFFQLTGHGISSELQGRVIKAAERLFALPLEEKQSLVSLKGELKNRGYEILGSQALQGGTLPDLKEVSLMSTSVVLYILSIFAGDKKAATTY